MVKRICLVCGYNDTTHESKEEYKEIILCPKCNGSFVDEWVSEKYTSIDATAHNIYCGRDQLKRWSRQQKEQADNTPLLTIELQDESSVPKVFYKGKEITNKVNVMFDWDTSDSRNPSGLTYAIEHLETRNKQLTNNRIERRCGHHA